MYHSRAPGIDVHNLKFEEHDGIGSLYNCVIIQMRPSPTLLLADLMRSLVSLRSSQSVPYRDQDTYTPKQILTSTPLSLEFVILPNPPQPLPPPFLIRPRNQKPTEAQTFSTSQSPPPPAACPSTPTWETPRASFRRNRSTVGSTTHHFNHPNPNSHPIPIPIPTRIPSSSQ